MPRKSFAVAFYIRSFAKSEDLQIFRRVQSCQKRRLAHARIVIAHSLLSAYITLLPTSSFSISTHRSQRVPLRNSNRFDDLLRRDSLRARRDETRGSSAELRVENRKNCETLPRSVTTTRTRIINPCTVAVPCTLYLPVITIFFFFHLLSISPIPGEARLLPPLGSLRFAAE